MRELMREVFSPCNSVSAQVDQITSVNVFALYSTTHYLAKSSRLINLGCDWILRALSGFYK